MVTSNSKYNKKQNSLKSSAYLGADEDEYNGFFQVLHHETAVDLSEMGIPRYEEVRQLSPEELIRQ